MTTPTPIFDWYTFFLLLGVVQGPFLAFFFIRKRADGPANLYLGLLLLVFSLSVLETFLNYSGLLFHILQLRNFSESIQFLVAPLLFSYLRSYYSQKPEKYWYWHAIPFLLYTGYLFFEFSQPVEQKYNSYIADYYPELPFVSVEQPYQSPDPLGIRSWLTSFGLLLQLVIYFCWGIFSLRKNQEGPTPSPFSRLLNQRFIRNFLLLAASGIVIFSVAKYGFSIVRGENLLGIYLTLFIYTVGYWVVSHSKFFQTAPKTKYQTSTLPDDFVENKIQRLQAYLSQEKPYLKNDYSLADLAKGVGLSEHHLSQIINEHLNTNFFGLVNKYRIKEACRRLEDPEYSHLTIEQLAYDLGYNSKSVFFAAFKKETKTTPNAYRKSKLNP